MFKFGLATPIRVSKRSGDLNVESSLREAVPTVNGEGT